MVGDWVEQMVYSKEIQSVLYLVVTMVFLWVDKWAVTLAVEWVD